ncbi:protein pygopus-like [Gigantopelta aegis]|uniref:protein pygopus-like n=1 Tax=Gigantopelta aegis TaxID=1735272 RepID=UPI001B888330|nr:protein pygopus-like [Gigantopelta aegis]
MLTVMDDKKPDSQKHTLAELLPPSNNTSTPKSEIVAQNPFEDQIPVSNTTRQSPSMLNKQGPPHTQHGPQGPPLSQHGPQGPGMAPQGHGSGKMYPPNQPMVFNPSNPNAPPIYPCGICHKEVHDNDQAILCESGCNFWFHRYCTGLTEAAFTMLKQEVYAEWVCDKCLGTKNIPLVKLKP